VTVQIVGASGFDPGYAFRGDLGLEPGYRAMSRYLTAEIYDLTDRRLFSDILENVEGHAVIHPDLSRRVSLLRLFQKEKSYNRNFSIGLVKKRHLFNQFYIFTPFII